MRVSSRRVGPLYRASRRRSTLPPQNQVGKLGSTVTAESGCGGSGNRDERHTIAPENAVDAGAPALQNLLQLLQAYAVAGADGKRDVEGKAKAGRIHRGRDRNDLERNGGAPGEVAGEWTPGHRQVNVAGNDGVDDAGRRVLLGVVTEDTESDQIAPDSPSTERMHRRRVGVVVTHQLYADAERLQGRIIERLDVQAAILAVHEDVGRAIVGRGGAHPLGSRRHAHHHVAAIGPEGIAEKAPTLGPPGIA